MVCGGDWLGWDWAVAGESESPRRRRQDVPCGRSTTSHRVSVSTEEETRPRASATAHGDITIAVDAGRAPVGEGLTLRLDPADAVPARRAR